MAAIPESVRVKIERADKHIVDLKSAIDDFWKRRPYQFIGYLDAQGRPTYQVADTKPIDPMIPTIAGDAIQCLRSALDRMACALWQRTNCGDCKIYFPIADDAAKYKSEALGKVKGLRQDAVDAIAAIEPYQGGNGEALWSLHRLSIIDRHRLPLTVGGGNLGVHIPSLYANIFPELAESGAYIISVAQYRAPLKKGDIIFVDDPGREVQKDLQLPLFIFFDEPGIFERKPVIPSLKLLRDSVNNAVNSLALLL